MVNVYGLCILNPIQTSPKYCMKFHTCDYKFSDAHYALNSLRGSQHPKNSRFVVLNVMQATLVIIIVQVKPQFMFSVLAKYIIQLSNFYVLLFPRFATSSVQFAKHN